MAIEKSIQTLREFLKNSQLVKASPETDRAQDAFEHMVHAIHAADRALLAFEGEKPRG